MGRHRASQSYVVGLYPPSPRQVHGQRPSGKDIVIDPSELEIQAECRLAAPGIARIVDDADEDGALTVHHCVHNQRAAHAALSTARDSAAATAAPAVCGTDCDQDTQDGAAAAHAASGDEGGDLPSELLQGGCFQIPAEAAPVLEAAFTRPGGIVVKAVVAELQAEGVLDEEGAEDAWQAVRVCVALGILVPVPCCH